MFSSELHDFVIILLELGICYGGTVYLKSFIDGDKVGRGEEPYFFSKTLPENLRDHLADTSFSVTSCHMEYFELVLRISEYFHHSNNTVSALTHSCRRERHDIIYGREVVWHERS